MLLESAFCELFRLIFSFKSVTFLRVMQKNKSGCFFLNTVYKSYGVRLSACSHFDSMVKSAPGQLVPKSTRPDSTVLEQFTSARADCATVRGVPSIEEPLLYGLVMSSADARQGALRTKKTVLTGAMKSLLVLVTVRSCGMFFTQS